MLPFAPGTVVVSGAWIAAVDPAVRETVVVSVDALDTAVYLGVLVAVVDSDPDPGVHGTAEVHEAVVVPVDALDTAVHPGVLVAVVDPVPGVRGTAEVPVVALGTAVVSGADPDPAVLGTAGVHGTAVVPV